MFTLFVPLKPVSFQNAKPSTKKDYKQKLRDAFSKEYPSFRPYSEDKNLYSTIYYYTKGIAKMDADNINKLILDSFSKGFLYKDDRIVKLCHAGKVEKQRLTYGIHDLTFSTNIQSKLGAFSKSDDVLYIEIGHANKEMFNFEQEKTY